MDMFYRDSKGTYRIANAGIDPAAIGGDTHAETHIKTCSACGRILYHHVRVVVSGLPEMIALEDSKPIPCPCQSEVDEPTIIQEESPMNEPKMVNDILPSDVDKLEGFDIGFSGFLQSRPGGLRPQSEWPDFSVGVICYPDGRMEYFSLHSDTPADTPTIVKEE